MLILLGCKLSGTSSSTVVYTANVVVDVILVGIVVV